VIERLSFDSEWFGLEVGRLACPVDGAARDWVAEADRFDLVYLAGRSLDVLPLGTIGGRITLVDERLDLERAPAGAASESPGNNVATLATDAEIEEAAAIAGTAFTTSRFYREDALKNRAGDLYRKWVRNRKGPVAEGTGILGFRGAAGGPVGGFLVFRPDAPCSRVDLIGVSDEMRDHGAGRALVEGLQSRVPGNGLRVRVSADNPRALDFYLSAGFRPRASDVVVHRWRRK
jgi:GNAT superfamily N-acetyltransferase